MCKRQSVLQPCVIPAESVDQESGISPEMEAARLALELAQEKSQRQKAENDFEVCFPSAHMATTTGIPISHVQDVLPCGYIVFSRG